MDISEPEIILLIQMEVWKSVTKIMQFVSTRRFFNHFQFHEFINL